MHERDSKQRFSDRVEDYVRYRPGYPAAVLTCLRDEFGLTPAQPIADVGSGTGISSEMFLRNGNAVAAIEPNDAMRAAAERLLAGYPGFESLAGSAEALPLAAASVDWVIAAQAFHWFDVDRARMEFRRVLRPAGRVMLLWNNRREDTPFLAAYEQLLRTYATDYLAIKHQNAEADGRVERFFCGAAGGAASGAASGAAGGGGAGPGADKPYVLRCFPNRQPVDYGGLEGRTLSASYMPRRGDARYPPMVAALRELFERSAQEGRVTLEYDTHAYVGRL